MGYTARHCAHVTLSGRTRQQHCGQESSICFFTLIQMDAALFCKRFNIDPISARKVYLCAIHKQGPLDEPLACTKCAQYGFSYEEALAGCIVLHVDELPEDDSRSVSFEVESK